ncbi:MAG: type II toxin-antitoxin system VapC family toxin [Synechococcaceae cyanobacterium]|nr:type II toxin-antitoxin system VapC family toxin [Synechococcaceae cyanobacterium]
MSAPAPAGEEESATGDVVLDGSLSCALGFADESSEEAWAVLERLQAGRAHVPALWLWETANVLVQAERRRRITPAAIRSFLGLLEALPISRSALATAQRRSADRL